MAVLLACVLVAGACSSGGKDKQASKPGRVRAVEQTTTSVEDTTSSSDASTSSSAAAPGTTKGTAARAPTTRRGTIAAPAPGPPPAPAPAPAPASVKPKLTRVATVTQPVAIATRPGDSALYVAEKTGRVRVIRNGAVQAAPLVDLSGQVSTGGEQGLLGLAFSPDGLYLYTYFTDTTGDVRIVEFSAAGGNRRDLLTIEHSARTNHNGGQLQTGPDGMLYAGIGDGGGGGDPDRNGQNTSTLLGKILRLNPRGSGIAAGNPFGNEVWSYGLRNPWRFSFDRATGEMWIADVGQGEWEEIDLEPKGQAGRNYGWNLREGTHPYNGGARPPNAVDPVYEYSHAGGACSVTGGYVYRGSRFPQLVGTYVFGDYCVGQIWGFKSGSRSDLGLKVSGLSSFGEGPDGELLACSLNDGGIYAFDAA